MSTVEMHRLAGRVASATGLAVFETPHPHYGTIFHADVANGIGVAWSALPGVTAWNIPATVEAHARRADGTEKTIQCTSDGMSDVEAMILAELEAMILAL